MFCSENVSLYCKDWRKRSVNDEKAIYLGQDGSITDPSQRNNESANPTGWKGIKYNWNGLCGYTGDSTGNQAYCNDLSDNSRKLLNPNTNLSFMCAFILGMSQMYCLIFFLYIFCQLLEHLM